MSRRPARRRRLGVWSRRHVFPRSPALSQGHDAPPDALHAGNTSSLELPCKPATDRQSVPRRPARAFPRRPPPVRWSLGGAQVAFKTSHGPWPRRAPTLPAKTEPPPAPLGSSGELQSSANHAPTWTLLHLPLHLHKLAGMPALPAAPHLAGTAGHGGHRAWPPAPHLAGPSPPRASKGIGPQGPRVPPAPAPGRSRPAIRRNLAGPPPAGA
jgi:hypothetical protein